MRKLLALLLSALLVLAVTTIDVHANPFNDLAARLQAVEQTLQNTTTSQNTFLGFWSGRYNKSFGNVGYGTFTFSQNEVKGNQNTGIGSAALYKISMGSNNSFIGNGAGMRLTGGSRNTGGGLCAGCGLVYGSNNAIFGEKALSEFDMSNTTAIGQEAGRYAESSGSVFIGQTAGYKEKQSNRLHISNNPYESLIYGEFDNRIVKVHGFLQAEKIQVGQATLYYENGNLYAELPSGTLVNLTD